MGILLFGGAVIFLIWAVHKYSGTESTTSDPVELARNREYQEAVRYNTKKLRERIQEEIDKKKSETVDEVDDYFIREYEQIKTMPVRNADDYNDIAWRFNDGNLRSKNEKYVHYGEYKADCATTTFIFSLVGFMIGFIPVMIALHEIWILAWVPAIAAGLFCLLIAQIIAHSVNISKGEKLNTDEANSVIKEQKIKRGIAIASTAISTASVAKHAKKATKDFANVDGWNEMK